jgi:hypothetical protein
MSATFEADRGGLQAAEPAGEILLRLMREAVCSLRASALAIGKPRESTRLLRLGR